MDEYGLFDQTETVLYLMPLDTALATDESEGEVSNDNETDNDQVPEEMKYDIDDIYAQMLSIRSKITSEIAVGESIERRMQRIETYMSVSVTLQSFIIGLMVGWLFLGRLR